MTKTELRKGMELMQSIGKLEAVIDGKNEQIADLTAKLEAMVKWLEKNQPDVFKRGIWDALTGQQEDQEATEHSDRT